MRVMLVTDRGARTRRYDLRYPAQVLALATVLAPLLLLVGASAFSAGFLADRLALTPAQRSLKQELVSASASLATAQATAVHQREAFARELGELRARLLRLDALGERLVKLSGLDDGEFDFLDPPSMGGPISETLISDVYQPEDLSAEIALTRARSESREQQLAVLENLLQSRRAQEQATPDGLPVRAGWISSHFGRRVDPFSGRKAHHQGVDIAGRHGAPVEAVASGIVLYAGRRGSYGNLVEIDHGAGLVTRYGHNAQITVKVGDAVQRGDVIATMGATGRATGPHLHFEVHRNGRAIDPLPFIKSGS